MPTVAAALQSGWQLHQQGRIDDAMRHYRRVLDQLPGHPEALVYLGIALFDQRQYEQAVASYRQALAVKEQFPIAWNNLGNALRMLGQVEQADDCFDRALAQDPAYLSAFKNRGTLWVWSGQIERGLKWYQQGLQLDPDNAELHRNLGVIHLLLGNNDVGWPEYRWRWRMPGAHRPDIPAPLWQGESLVGKSILLYPEQGRGDAIQFVRVAKVLRDVGARVMLQCQPNMIPLFTSAPGVDVLLPAGAVPPAVDFHASLIDVVDVWYARHQEIPYGSSFIQAGYLNVSEALVDYWHRRLASLLPLNKLKVGINWQGNPQHHADHYRSLPLTALAPLARLPNVSLVNLQFGFGVQQIASCGFADQIQRLPDDVDTTGGAFTDTAAILRNLDVIVTSDTAIAHLAGALGVRVILLLGKVPDWRWLTAGDSTPWYPSLQLVRQATMGSWDDVIEDVVAKLSDLLE